MSGWSERPTTAGITGIIGRIDKNNMFDRDVFNSFPEKYEVKFFINWIN